MKNIIVFYIAFLLILLGSSCSKKDKQVVYPVVDSNIVYIPKPGEGQLVFNGATTTTTSVSVSGNTLSVVAGDKTIKFTFNNPNFAINNYITTSTVAADTDVKVEITDNTIGETYVVADNSVVIISTQTIPNSTTQVTYLALASSTAKATVNTSRADITAELGVVIK